MTAWCSAAAAGPPPEQLRTGWAAPAVDVFAWGCVLAHLASGVHPIVSLSAKEWILRIGSAEPDLSRLPPEMEEMIRARLERDARHLAAISLSTDPKSRGG